MNLDVTFTLTCKRVPLIMCARGLCVFALSVVLPACSDQPRDYTALDNGGFDAIVGSREYERLDELFAALPFDSIELTHVGCNGGSCPQFTIRLRRDGTATYDGGPNAPMVGLKEAHTAFIEYGRLCEFIESHDLVRRMADVPEYRVTHTNAYELRLWPTGRSVPLMYDGSWFEPPGDAIILRGAIDGLITSLQWE